jgi:hypothetical protein
LVSGNRQPSELGWRFGWLALVFIEERERRKDQFQYCLI